jgi:hypothetical protein
MTIGNGDPVDLDHRSGWAVSFASVVNALSIPLIAGILIWLLDRVLSPDKWCPALEEFKTAAAAGALALRCQPILLAQLEVGFYTSVGLVGALALSHLVSVVREAKAGFALDTKLGSLTLGGDIGGDNKVAKAAEHVRDKAQEGLEEVRDVIREGGEGEIK